MIVVMGALFLVGFAGITIAALTTFPLTVGSLLLFGFAFAVIILIAVALISAVRNPPDQ